MVTKSREIIYVLREVTREKSRKLSQKVAKSQLTSRKILILREVFMYFAKFVAKSRENHHGLREVDREKSRSWSRKVAKSRNVFAKLAINREFSRSDEKLCEKPSWGVLVSRCLLFSLREVSREKSRCYAMSSRKVAKFFFYFAKLVAKSRDVLR